MNMTTIHAENIVSDVLDHLPSLVNVSCKTSDINDVIKTSISLFYQAKQQLIVHYNRNASYLMDD